MRCWAGAASTVAGLNVASTALQAVERHHQVALAGGARDERGEQVGVGDRGDRGDAAQHQRTVVGGRDLAGEQARPGRPGSGRRSRTRVVRALSRLRAAFTLSIIERASLAPIRYGWCPACPARGSRGPRPSSPCSAAPRSPARASGQNTAWLAEGAHWSASPVVPCPQTTVLFFLFVFGVRTRPVAVIAAPVTVVVTYAMRLPLASGASSGGQRRRGGEQDGAGCGGRGRGGADERYARDAQQGDLHCGDPFRDGSPPEGRVHVRIPFRMVFPGTVEPGKNGNGKEGKAECVRRNGRRCGAARRWSRGRARSSSWVGQALHLTITTSAAGSTKRYWPCTPSAGEGVEGAAAQGPPLVGVPVVVVAARAERARPRAGAGRCRGCGAPSRGARSAGRRPRRRWPSAGRAGRRRGRWR